MSEYFRNKNDGREFGPGPAQTTMWLVVDPINDALTHVCYVRAKTAYQARCEAERHMPALSNAAKFYPNAVRYPSDE